MADSHPEKPTLIWDGDCGFCRVWIDHWQLLTGPRVRYEISQDVGDRYGRLRFGEAVHLVEPDGCVHRGARAVFGTLAHGGRGAGLWAYEKIPGFAPLTEAAYKVVARHRVVFSWLTYLLVGERVEPTSHQLTRWLFLRGLGLVYLIAFLSLWVQLPGLVGSQGILASSYSDGEIRAFCAAGMAASALFIAGFAPLPLAAALWFLYARMCGIFGEFLWFQWDALMLEMGALAVFLVPWRQLLPRGPARCFEEERTPGVIVWLLRWLVFRIIFYSGYVKLASGDPSWRNLTALQFHFETQPIPTPPAWYFHHLPAGVLQASAIGMFAVELVIPFLIFLPRRLRFVAAAVITAFQLAIDFLGNYGFFGWQVVVLCILLLDDRFLARGRLEAARKKFIAKAPRVAPVRATVSAAVAFIVLGVSLFNWNWVSELVAPLHSINRYGVFAVMTTERDEIVIEGSDDQKTWLEYEFRYKPGDVRRATPFVEPHMPRLDWQMWFAALGPNDAIRGWLGRFIVRLADGSPPVLELIAKNPFPREPPKWLRVLYYRYRFTDPATRSSTGAWWIRELKGELVGPTASINLRN